MTLRIYPNQLLILLTSFCLNVLTSGCGVVRKPDIFSRSKSNDSRMTDSNFASFNGLGVNEKAVVITATPNIDALHIALSECHCAPEASRILLEHAAMSRRALPQALVPKIREEIRSNPLLAAVDQLPGVLGEIISSLATSDAQMATQIRAGILKTLNPTLTAVGTGTFLQNAPFRFDLFGAPSNTNVAVTASQPPTFSVAKAATLWGLVFGADDLWTASGSTTTDVGAQILEVTRTFAEWAYLLGIGGDGQPNGLGGVAFDIKLGNSQFSAPKAPTEITDDEARFISGDYTISYPRLPTVLLATKVQESWQSAPGAVTLLEQASVWRAAALAFGRMRSDKPGGFRTLFTGDSPPLSSTSPALPLIWLPAMADFLKNSFINKDTRAIYNVAKSADGAEPAEASLDALTMLGFALHDWILATRNIAQTDLAPDVKDRLSTLESKLKDPLRLAIVTILNRHTKIKHLDDQDWITFDNAQLEDHQINAAIALLVSSEQDILKGDLLKARATALFHWYIAKKLMPASDLSAANAAWILHNSKRMEVYPSAPSWIHSLSLHLESALGGYKP
jgi:hypothetical protein